ncbi:MAG: Bax inhibitor-1/YccA family protein [Pseudomonadota bacterium]
MADYQPSVAQGGVRADIDEGLRAYMNKVYMLMATAMVLTGGVAFYVGNNAALLETFFTGPIRWVVMFAPLIFVFAFAAMINRMSASTATMVFYAFGAVMGLSIAWIFAVFTDMSIAQTFFATAVAFLGLSLYGYTTKKDLSGWGSFLIMGVIGLIVVSIANIFIGSGLLQTAIAAIGVLLFAALTAYDTQSIKNEYLEAAQAGPAGEAYLEKGAIMGALRLYLDFVNMFMFLLQFMGAADE